MIVSSSLDHIRNSIFFVLEKEFCKQNDLKLGDRIHFRVLNVLHHKNKELIDLKKSPLILHYKISQSYKVIINFRMARSLNLEQYDVFTLDLIERERYPEYYIED